MLTVLLALFMLSLGAGGALDPVQAASGFGLPITGTDAIPWLHVKAGRDLGVGLALLVMVVLRERRATAGFVAACVVMPVVDGVTTVVEGGSSIAMALAVHGSAAAYCAALACALFRGTARA